jgi:hypothetical protein
LLGLLIHTGLTLLISPVMFWVALLASSLGGGLALLLGGTSPSDLAQQELSPAESGIFVLAGAIAVLAIRFAVTYGVSRWIAVRTAPQGARAPLWIGVGIVILRLPALGPMVDLWPARPAMRSLIRMELRYLLNPDTILLDAWTLVVFVALMPAVCVMAADHARKRATTIPATAATAA